MDGLGRRADRVAVRLHELFPTGQVLVSRPTPAPPPVPAPVPVQTQLDRIRQRLAAEVQSGQVEIGRVDRYIYLRIASAGLFGSGLARVSPALAPVLDHVAQALAPEPGRIVVIRGDRDEETVAGDIARAVDAVLVPSRE